MELADIAVSDRLARDGYDECLQEFADRSKPDEFAALTPDDALAYQNSPRGM